MKIDRNDPFFETEQGKELLSKIDLCCETIQKNNEKLNDYNNKIEAARNGINNNYLTTVLGGALTASLVVNAVFALRYGFSLTSFIFYSVGGSIFFIPVGLLAKAIQGEKNLKLKNDISKYQSKIVNLERNNNILNNELKNAEELLSNDISRRTNDYINSNQSKPSDVNNTHFNSTLGNNNTKDFVRVRKPANNTTDNKTR